MSCDKIFFFEITWRSNHDKRVVTSWKVTPKIFQCFYVLIETRNTGQNSTLRHASAKHDLVNKVKLETNELLELIKEAASKLNSGDWFSSNVRSCWGDITSDSEKVEKLLEL